MGRALYRVGHFCAAHPLRVLLAWVVLAAGVVAAMSAVGSLTSNDLTLPGTQSQQASDLLATKFPPQQNGSSPIVFHAVKGKITDKDNKNAVEASYKALLKAPHVYSATDPFGSSSSALISTDDRTAFSPVLLNISSGQVTEELAQRIFDATAAARKQGIEVAAGGTIGTALSPSPTESSEVVGLLTAMLILALTFGSFVAMGVPIITAVLGLATALGVIGLLTHLFTVPTVGPTLATMIGLGVGIDYALFLVSKYREHLGRGLGRHESIALAVATSGSAIVFAGTTVVIALVSLAVAGIPLVSTLGFVTAIAVLTAVIAAISLLPAVLSLLGAHVFGARLPAFLRPAHKRPAPACGAAGRGGDPAPRGLRRRGAGDPGAPDHPPVLPAPGPGGHRRDAHEHDRAPGLRPAVAGIRARLQRPAAHRHDAVAAGPGESAVPRAIQPGQGAAVGPEQQAEDADRSVRLAEIPAGIAPAAGPARSAEELPPGPAGAARGAEGPAYPAAGAAAGAEGTAHPGGEPAAQPGSGTAPAAGQP